jgi:hypothetical protein
MVLFVEARSSGSDIGCWLPGGSARVFALLSLYAATDSVCVVVHGLLGICAQLSQYIGP